MFKRLDPDSPLFVTRSAHFNFLREYRKACAGDDIQPQELVSEASIAWQALSPEEKSLFEEADYLAARLAKETRSAMGIAVDLLIAQGKNIFGKARPRRSKKVAPQEQGSESESEETTRVHSSAKNEPQYHRRS